MFYRVNSSTAGATQRDNVSKQNSNNLSQRKTGEPSSFRHVHTMGVLDLVKESQFGRVWSGGQDQQCAPQSFVRSAERECLGVKAGTASHPCALRSTGPTCGGTKSDKSILREARADGAQVEVSV